MLRAMLNNSSGDFALSRFATTNTWPAAQTFSVAATFSAGFTSTGLLQSTSSSTTVGGVLSRANGTISANPAGIANTAFQSIGAEAVVGYSIFDAAASNAQVLLRRRNGTYASQTAIANGNNLGSVAWQGFGASTFGTVPAAEIRGSAAEAFTESARGTSLEFYVTPVGSTTNSLGFRLSSGTLLTGHNAEFFGSAFFKNNTGINFESVAGVAEAVFSISTANNVTLASPSASGGINLQTRASTGPINIIAGSSTGTITLQTGGSTRLTIASTGIATFARALASGVATLTDAANIALDASLGNHFRVTLAGNRTLNAPTNPTDGQRIAIEVIQDATGSRTLTLTTGALGFAFGTDIPSITLTTTANLRDFIECVYNSTTQRWYVVRFVKGY